MNLARSLARWAVATPFALLGWDALSAPEGHRERARHLAPLVEPLLGAAGLELTDAVSDASARALGGAYCAGAVALGAGILPRLAGAGLAAAHVPVTLANHPFWLHGANERATDARGIARGAALIAGALLAGSLGGRRG